MPKESAANTRCTFGHGVKVAAGAPETGSQKKSPSAGTPAARLIVRLHSFEDGFCSPDSPSLRSTRRISLLLAVRGNDSLITTAETLNRGLSCARMAACAAKISGLDHLKPCAAQSMNHTVQHEKAVAMFADA